MQGNEFAYERETEHMWILWDEDVGPSVTQQELVRNYGGLFNTESSNVQEASPSRNLDAKAPVFVPVSERNGPHGTVEESPAKFKAAERAPSPEMAPSPTIVPEKTPVLERVALNSPYEPSNHAAEAQLDIEPGQNIPLTQERAFLACK